MAEHYYVVGKHGPPTKETAPHGYMYVADGDWKEGVRYGTRMNPLFNPLFADDSVWWPLPAPPTEEAPAPEPVEWWTVNEAPGREMARLLYRGCGVMAVHEAHRAADALNTLEADGVVWGPGRPMSELPDVGLVLVQMSSGVPYTFYVRKADYIATHRNTYDCWWPLPLPGEAQ